MLGPRNEGQTIGITTVRRARKRNFFKLYRSPNLPASPNLIIRRPLPRVSSQIPTT